MSTKRLTIRSWAMLAGAATAFVFWPCLQNGFLNWDDIAAYIGPAAQQGGLSLRALRWAFLQSATVAGYYHPLTWVSLLLDYRLWGLHPLPYHAMNLGLHVLNTMLLVVYLERLLRFVFVFSELERCAIAFVAGIVFALHPLQVESVAWIAERKTLLCALFIVGCLYAHVRLAERQSSRTWLFAMNGGFVLALLSKPMAIPLPIVLLVLDWYPLRRYSSSGWWRLVKEKIPMLVLSALAAIATLFTQSQHKALNTSLGFIDRMLMVPRNLVFYLWKLVWPAWLSPFYPVSPGASVRSAEYFVPLALCVGLFAAAIWYRRRLPSLWSALCVYVLFLAPVSGIVPLGDYAVADRYAYLAIVPVLVFTAGAGVLVWRRLRPTARIALAILVGCQVSFYAYASRAQISAWRDDETLWSAVLSHYPNYAMANCQLAAALIDRRQFEQAYVFARRAVELAPGYPEALATAGFIDLKLRRYTDAAKQLNEAIEMKPTLLTSRYNLSCAYARLGRLADAYDLLQKLIGQHPEYALLARRDGELTVLRNDPRYAARFAELVSPASK